MFTAVLSLLGGTGGKDYASRQSEVSSKSQKALPDCSRNCYILSKSHLLFLIGRHFPASLGGRYHFMTEY